MDEIELTPTPDPDSPTGVYIPSDLQDCFRELDSMLSAGELEGIRGCEEINLIQHHFGLGTWMRNNWGLWSERSQLKQYFVSQGVQDADSASCLILVSYWRYLNQKA